MFNIDEAKRLADAADKVLEGVTEGDWIADYLDHNDQRVVKGPHIEVCTCWHHSVGSIEKEMEANARFIAYARQGVPALAAALSASLERERELREALADLHYAVCGETGFAAAVRGVSGLAYPWPALDLADEKARRALGEATKGGGFDMEPIL